MSLTQELNGRAALGSSQLPGPRVLTLERGPFDASHLVGSPQESFGILVLDGLIMARVDAGRAHTGWLIGADDLLRPWEMPEISLVRNTQWRALLRTRVLRLDRGFRRRLAQDPRLVQAILAGAARTTHWLLAKSLITSSPVVEDRVLLLFALYGERWGKVTPEGVWLDLPLTHEMIGQLCGARRPTISTTLRSLHDQGVVTHSSSRPGWLLHLAGDPDKRGHCWPDFAMSLGPALHNGRAGRPG